MAPLEKLLVGVDLLQAEGVGSTNFSPPVAEAIKHGLWLAEKSSASLTFFAAVDVPVDDISSLGGDATRVAGQLQEAGGRVLGHLVREASARGVTADARLVTGEGWVEMTREVQRGQYDLAIVGTRNVGALQRFLFGSTAMKLLHNCPCPVWVTRPEPHPLPTNILVASDLTEVGEIALRLGISLGTLSGAKMNLLHAVDYPLDRLWSTGLMDTSTQIYHNRVQADARERLEEQLAKVAGPNPPCSVELHIAEGLSIADNAILDFIRTHQIDLLIMGTMARSGIPGVFIGNTAERLVTHMPCSLLAVKPADFVSPIEAV